MEIPSMTILSSTSSTAAESKRQLEDCFKDTMSFKTVVFSDWLEPHSVSDDFILITNMLIKDRALNYIKPGTKYFISDRTINADIVERLYDIPEGADVLLVNVTKDTTLEAITQLDERGIRHLNFFPYYPEVQTYNTNCRYAITFGEVELVPEGNYQIIDLGIRPIDMTTCVKIAIEIGLYEEVKRNISTVFMRSGIEISCNYAKQLKKIQVLTGNLQMILNRFKGSVLLVDEAQKVLFFNPRAQRLLKIQDFTSNYLPSLMQKRFVSGENFFFEIEDYSYYVESFSNLHDGSGNIIFVINDIKNIEKIENDYRAILLKDGLIAKYSFDDIIFESASMKQLIQKSKQFAKSNSTIAIYGNSGSGKELIAQAIHNASNRKNEAFVAINFAALSSTLSEAELFGYVDGAFTGAKRGGKKGLFELAHRGTIFLDEIGDCSLDIQKKILRVIQERNVMPIGGNKVIPIDIRIIAATNQNLYKMIKNKEFREDLYYRLNVLPLKTPPLQDRKEDIIPLLLYFLNESFGVNISEIPDELKDALINHPWNGNVRELRNVAEYIANCMISNVPWQDQLDEILFVEDGSDFASKSDKMVELIKGLETQCELITSYKILKTINSPPHLWNRVTITEKLRDSKITESTIKRYLSILKQHGLIQSKSGQGSYINHLGKEFLDYYDRNYI